MAGRIAGFPDGRAIPAWRRLRLRQAAHGGDGRLPKPPLVLRRLLRIGSDSGNAPALAMIQLRKASFEARARAAPLDLEYLH